MTFAIGDRVQWCISPDTVEREALVWGEMAYSSGSTGIYLIGDAHHLGMPISGAWLKKIASRDGDVALAQALRETYLRRCPSALK